MSKYSKLEEFLMFRREPEVPMTFEEIEEIIGSKLPPAARRWRAWWANNVSSGAMTRSWMRAGFESARVDMAGGRLVFRRRADRPDAREADPALAVAEAAAAYSVRGRHPLRGALQGLVRVAPGTDLTAPADPDWGGA